MNSSESLHEIVIECTSEFAWITAVGAEGDSVQEVLRTVTGCAVVVGCVKRLVCRAVAWHTFDGLPVTCGQLNGHVAGRLSVGQVPCRARVVVARSELGEDCVCSDPSVVTVESTVAIANGTAQTRAAAAAVRTAPSTHASYALCHIIRSGRGPRSKLGSYLRAGLRLAPGCSTDCRVDSFVAAENSTASVHVLFLQGETVRYPTYWFRSCCEIGSNKPRPKQPG